MASNVSRPLARSVKARMFSAAAAQAEPAAASVDREQKFKHKKLSNGLVVATVESASPVSRLAVVAKAGSRFESGDNLGISHVLRQAAKLRTANMSQLAITRATQDLGADITCEGTREYVYYKSSVNRNFVPNAVELLKEITTKQAFRRWEVEDLQHDPNGLKLELAILNSQPHIRAIELLHSAAFRNSLGRSLYCPDFMVGGFSNLQLQDYCEKNLSSGRLALVGVGVDSAVLEALGESFAPHAGAQGEADAKAVYYGGEERHNVGGELSYVAMALAGPSVGSPDLLASEVLKYHLGVGPAVKYSDGVTGSSLLAKASAKATSAPHFVSSLSANYSDGGLFGFSAVAHSSQIDQVVKAAANQLKSSLSADISEQDVAKAKNQLKASIAMQFENQDSLLSWVGEQALSGDKIITPQEVYSMVDSITAADVNKAAKTIAASKPSLASAGNTSNVSYVDQL